MYFKTEGVKPSAVNSMQDEFITAHSFPNPFNESTTISYELKTQNKVEISIYNATGRKISTLVNEQQLAGKHSIIFNAVNLANGIYVYKIKTGTVEQRGKLLLMK